MTGPLRPRALVHRGVVAARGFVVDEGALGADVARARVLAHWEPGARVVRLDASELVLVLPHPRWVSSAASPGAPLVAAADVLSTAPLVPSELAVLEPARGAVVRVRAGEAIVYARSESVDPSLWLDLAPFEIVEARPIGEAPTAPRLVVEALHASAREVFGGAVAPPPPAMFEALSAFAKSRGQHLPDPPSEASAAAAAEAGGGLARAAFFAAGTLAAIAGWMFSRFGERAQRRAQALAAPRRPSTPASGSGAAASLGWLAPLFALLGRFFGAGQAAPRQSTGLRAPEPRPADQPSEAPGGRLRAWLTRRLMRTGLGTIFGRRQAEYVRTMLRMFDEGDLDRALRHAIPLAEGEGSGGAPALGVPQPRADLTIGLGAVGAGPALRFSENLFDHLKRLYRQAFERLDAQGRHQEAAFVLAELLRQSEEAVSYLERKDELRLAAELAEARGLPPALVVRQWLLARDARRAVLLARRHDAFAQAVERLGDSVEGRHLRRLWAETLAEAGRYAAAVEVALPLPEARRLALRWAELGIELGGEGGARLLARRPGLEAGLAKPVPVLVRDAGGRGPVVEARGALLAQLVAAVEARGRDAEAYERLRPTLEGWLAAEGPGAHGLRLALADQLGREPARPAVRAMAGATLRALLREYPAAGSTWGRRECEALARVSGDAALEADLPPLPARPALDRSKREGTPLELDFDATDAGAQPVYDAAPLPGGRLLVALGEGGAVLLGPSGRRLASFPRPAHWLVVSDEGDRALALAPRGASMRVSRFNLLDRRSDDWCDARLERWARSFDGDRWIVASSRLGENKVDLWVVDALDDRWSALRRVDDVGASVRLIDRVAGECVVATSRPERDAEAIERWRFRPACETLLERAAAEPAATSSLLAEGPLWAARAAPQPALLALDIESPGGPWLTSWSGRDFSKTILPDLEGEPQAIAALGTLVAVASRRVAEGGCVVGLWEAPAGREARLVALWRLHGARRARVRAERGLFVACDDAGRVVTYDVEAAALAHNVRF